MRIILECSAKELAAAFEDFRKRFADKPEAPEKTADSCDFNVGFLPVDNEVNELFKAQAKLHRQVRRQLHSSSQQS